MIKLQAMREAAESAQKAEPGDWMSFTVYDHMPLDCPLGGEVRSITEDRFSIVCKLDDLDDKPEVLRHIALSNPTTVIALLDVVEAARDKIKARNCDPIDCKLCTNCCSHKKLGVALAALDGD